MLCRNRLAAETSLACERFLLDDPGKFGDDGAAAGTNQLERGKWFDNGRRCDFKIPLTSDVLRLDKYLPDQCSIDIKLTRTPDSFLLTKPKSVKGDFFIKIHELRLVVRHIGLQG